MARAGRLSRLGVLLALLGLLVGCASGPAGTPGAGPTGQPQRGGSLTFLIIGGPSGRTLDPASFDPNGPTAVVGGSLYGQLVVTDPASGKVVPRLAESFSTADKLVWTLVLRPGLKFTDGTPYDADAVKYAWSRYSTPGVASEAGAPAAATIADMTVVDPRTLRIRLVAPNGQFDRLVLTTSLNHIGSPTALKAGADGFNKAPIGAGPFVLQEWVRDDRIVLRRNPGYFDQPKPYLDELVIRSILDPNLRLQSVQTGDADIVYNLNPDLANRARDMGLVTLEQPTGVQIIQMNLRKPPFDDVRARQAVSLAVDMDALNQAVFGGAVQVAHTLYPQGSPFYLAQPQLYVHDRDRAQQLFDQLAAEGKPVKFTILTYASDAQKVVVAVQAQLRSYRNVTVDIEVRDVADVWARLGAQDFQATPWVISGDDPEPNLFSAMSSTSKRDYTGIDDPELNAALLAGRNANSDADRVAAYKTAQERISALVPFIPYGRWSPGLIMRNTVGGAGFFGIAAPVLDTLWLAQGSS